MSGGSGGLALVIFWSKARKREREREEEEEEEHLHPY